MNNDYSRKGITRLSTYASHICPSIISTMKSPHYARMFSKSTHYSNTSRVTGVITRETQKRNKTPSKISLFRCLLRMIAHMQLSSDFSHGHGGEQRKTRAHGASGPNLIYTEKRDTFRISSTNGEISIQYAEQGDEICCHSLDCAYRPRKSLQPAY